MNEIEDEYGQLQCELTRIRIEKEKIDIKTAMCIFEINKQTLKSAKCIYETQYRELECSKIKLERTKAGKQHE
jgi:hypothetical protein